MITFYKADETDFDNNGLGVLDHDIQNPDIEEKLNDIFTFSFNYPIFGVNGSRLAARMIVKADDPENEGQLFRIMKLSKSNGMLTAFCYHIFYDLNGNEIPDTNIVGQNGQTAITQMLSKTAVAHKFQGYSDISDIANIRVVRMSPVKFLIDPQADNNFINRLGGEIRRVNYRIWMNKVRGSDNGATIRWKKSLDSYNATWDYTTIATRIRPVGYNGIMLPESYVDSPLIDKYETIVIKEIQYSDIKAIDPNATSNDETAVPLEQAYELLRQAAAKEFSENNLDKPTVTLSVNMVALRNMDEYKDVKSLETINPWDTVTVINERDGLSVKVRLNHYHWNPVTRKFISMELGNAKSTFTDIGSKVDHATNIANQADDTAKHASASADGKNTIYRDVKHEDIVNPVNGDTCFEKNGDKEEIWIYNGKSVPPSWELIVDDATGEEVRQNVDAAQKEAEEAKKTANESVAAANDAVAKAGFATDAATQAKSDAATAGQQAKDALTSVGTALSDAQNALTNSSSAQADSAQARKDSAAAAADASSAIAKANSTASEFGKVSQKADSALASALSAQNDASAAVSQASSAAADSKDAKQIAGSVSQSYKTLTDGSTMTIAELESGLAAKLTKTDLDGYSTQTWTQNQIKMTADGINGTMSSIKSTVDSQTTSINDLKADSSSFKSQFTTVNNTLGKQTTDISSLQASSKELSSNFSSLNTDNNTNKNDISQLKQTASEVTSTLETVQTQVTNSAVGTNLLINSNFSSGLDHWAVNGENCKAVVTTDSEGDICVHITGTSRGSGLYCFPSFNQNQVTTGSVLVKGTGELSLVGLEARPASNFGTISTESYSKVSSTMHAASTTNAFTVYFNPVDGVIDVYIKLLKLELGSRATDYSVSPLDTATVMAVSKISQTVNGIQTTVSGKADQSQITQLAGQITSVVGDVSANSSQITQMKADINLRVKAGDVVNQINISPESILIAGQKVHITGQTSIDNAVIKDAMIADIKADKITAGTLNAANVNVINLNANSITTGTIKGAELSMNLNTGEVVFQHGRIHSASNNIDINVDEGYVSVANNKTRVLLKDGGIQFVQPTIFDHQTNPYLDISNSGGAQSFHGASIVGRDFLALSNSANNSGSFTFPMGIETFAGISFGNAGTWRPTKIGGADRGILLSGGARMSTGTGDAFGSSPNILVGSNNGGAAFGNRIAINGEFVHIISAYRQTASGGPNVIVTQDGALVRSTSASKYKTDIVRTNKSDYGDKLLNLPTATWMDIAETKRYQDNPTTQPEPTRNFGMIAEDLAEAGLEMLVVRGTDGELEGINYDRIGPALIPVIAKLKNKIEKLEQKLEEPA
ncbi:phage tail spike protein [Latilactobacillus curvatus]